MPGASVLDVGCGSRSPFCDPDLRPKLSELVGVDAFADALELSRDSGLFDQLVQGDVRNLRELFPPRSFDVVAAVDLLEHLSADEGAELLAAMGAIARIRILVFTPNGFVQQGVLEGNPWQEHRSGWTAEDLHLLGFDVIGMHGLRILRGAEAEIRLRPKRAWGVVSDFTGPVARRAPRLAFHLLAAKDVT